MDHRRKLEFASAKIAVLSQQITAFLHRGYALRDEAEAGAPSTSFEVWARQAPPPVWELEAGACLHSMRSSLDHLAYILVHLNSPQPKRPRKIQFPVFLERAEYDKAKLGFMREAHPDVQREVERLQPFAQRADPARHPLWLLHDLDISDKHRRINPTIAAADVWIRQDLRKAGLDGYAEQPVFKGEVSDGMKIPRAPASGFFKHPPADAEVHVSFDIHFAGDGPAARLPVRDVLVSIHRYIRDSVFPALEPYLR